MRMLSNALRVLKAVLWGFIGLGGRQADAESRLDGAGGLLPLVLVGLVLVVLLVGGLIVLARFAAGAA